MFYFFVAIELGNKMGDETFHATHPFLFYIEDETTGTITYMGIVNDPLEKSRVSKPQPQLNLPNRFGAYHGKDEIFYEKKSCCHCLYTYSNYRTTNDFTIKLTHIISSSIKLQVSIHNPTSHC